MPKPVVFVSYSTNDVDWKTRFVKQLEVLERQDYLEVWTDDDIRFGDKWLREIEAAADQAAAAVLLITPDFLTSDFINQKEIPLLRSLKAKLGLRLLPVIVRPCPWEKVPWLGEIEVRPKPDPAAKRKKGQPISEASDTEQQERYFKEIVEEILDIVKAQPVRRTTGGFRHIVECPDLLPYRCDRTDQADELQDALRAVPSTDGRVVACIVHGDELACHDKFVEVLNRYDLPKILGLGDQMNVKSVLLDWPKKYETFESLKARLLGRIEREYGEAKNINLHPGPLLAHAHVLSTQLRKDTVEFFVKFWDQWPKRSKGRPIVACLCVKYVESAGLFDRLLGAADRRNERVRAMLAAGDGNGTAVQRIVLSQLGRVERGDAEQWARSSEVKRFRPGVDLVHKVTALYHDESNKPIDMQPLAQQLKTILESPD